MKITLWGVRGSLPSSIEPNSVYGNNTACVSIDLGDTLLIFDAGSGLFQLERTIKKTYERIIICITHVHWDHLIGLPFYTKLYNKHSEVILVSPHPEFGFKTLRYLMNGVNFPVRVDDIIKKPKLITSGIQTFFKSLSISFDFIKVDHPGDSYAFLLESEGKRLVYCPDNEINPTNKDSELIKNFSRFSKDCDLMIHDCQYSADDFKLKAGWGHTFFPEILEIASKVNVKELLLFHHDPNRTDKELKEV
eukprot:gene18134-gene733